MCYLPIYLFIYLCVSAPGGCRRKEDQESGGIARRDSDEKAGDQTEALRGARDHHGQRARGRESFFLSLACAPQLVLHFSLQGARCSSVVRAFAHGAMGIGSILHSGPIKLFLVPASAPRLVLHFSPQGARCSSMVRWVIGSILHSGPIELFLIQTSAPVCGMVHIKEP